MSSGRAYIDCTAFPQNQPLAGTLTVLQLHVSPAKLRRIFPVYFQGMYGVGSQPGLGASKIHRQPSYEVS